MNNLEVKKKVLASFFLYSRYKTIKRKRIHWIHPLNARRCTNGVFYTLYQQLRNNEDKFVNYFRMSISTFDELLQKVKNQIQKENTNMRDCIDPEEMLAVTLRYLATGCSFTDLHYSFRLGISTISRIVKEVCHVIWSTLKAECFPPLTKEVWENIAFNFELRANFPHCLGAVDGKHIRIINPLGSMFHNYKGYSSIVLMAVADADYRFVYVDVGSYGKDCDSTIFKNSSLWQAIENGFMELPTAKPIPGFTEDEIPYFLIGDEAFALHKHLLRPFSGHGLPIKKRIFNYRLSRARRYVECAFGILSNKFRIFHRSINLEPEFAVSITKACVTLHNFIRDRDGYNFNDTMSIAGFQDTESANGSMIRGGVTEIRNKLADYFMTEEGSLSWQMSKI